MNDKSELKAGQELYAIPTGVISVFQKKSREAVNVICKQDGFLGVHPLDGYTLWFFDTENNAKKCRNVMRSYGIGYGKNISKFIVDKGGVPVFDEKYAKDNGMM